VLTVGDLNAFQSHLDEHSDLTDLITEVFSADLSQSVQPAVTGASGSLQVIDVSPADVTVSDANGPVQPVAVDAAAVTSEDIQTGEDGTEAQVIGVDPSPVHLQSIEQHSPDVSVTGTSGATSANVAVSPQNCLLRSPDAVENSPCSAKRGVPVRFKKNISSAFNAHIFYPSPPKKAKT